MRERLLSAAYLISFFLSFRNKKNQKGQKLSRETFPHLEEIHSTLLFLVPFLP